VLFDCKTKTKKAFANSRMNRKSSVHEILFVDNQFLICLLENGRCSVHQLCKSLVSH